MRIVKSIVATALVAVIALIAFAFNARSSAQQPSAPAAPQAAAGSRIEYSSLQSVALGQELKFAVQLPPSYDKDTKRKYPLLIFLHGMFGNEGEFEKRGVAAAIDKLREGGKIGEM